MKRILVVLLTIALTSNAFAEITKWWGMVSFRQRMEVYEEYVEDLQNTNFGDIRFKEDNSKTRLGYQFGFFADVYDNLTAGVTLRSGLGSVMWQDIDNDAGLVPGLQEAYLDWQTPYAQVQLGKYPQRGNAMWDLYAAPLWTDFRQDDPRDGVFADRISALSGARVFVPVGPATLRGTYHTDYVGGKVRTWPEDSNREDDVLPRLDQRVLLLGAELDLSEYVEPYAPGMMGDLSLSLDFDYGLVYRSAYRQRAGNDSIYAEEELWGVTLKTGPPMLQLQVGYGYNSRDSVFKSDYLDLMLGFDMLSLINPLTCMFNSEICNSVVSGLFKNTRLTGRYQDNTQEHQAGIYKDHKAERRAYHLYLNRMIWNLDIQPRYIWFMTEIDGTKTGTLRRYEITATVRF